jgi:sortase A
MICSGLALGGLAIYSMTLGETMSASNQQAAAETEPLVVPDQGIRESNLEVGQIFAKLYVPRFGEDYVRNIAQGTSVAKVLNTVGVGHYTNTQMPGEIGNFALAGHRAGNGGPMRLIDKLVAGDLAYVETAETRFTYRFIESKIVKPEEIQVIDPVPAGLKGASAGGKYLTLTTCTPIYINSERYVAWFELVAEEPNR